MIIEVGNPELWKDEWLGTRVLLNGKDIRGVFYVDTEAGIVKTFNVFQDDRILTTSNGFGRVLCTDSDFPGREVECFPDDVVRETLRGKVELIFPDGTMA